jgi:OmpA-OmpF porin, OOP family
MGRDSMFRFAVAALAFTPGAWGARATDRARAAARHAQTTPVKSTPICPGLKPPRQLALGLALAWIVLVSLGSTAVLAQTTRPATGDQPVRSQAVPAEKTPADMDNRTTSMMAQGLFDGDQLTAEAQARLTDFIIDSVGRQVEIALIIPRGPWVVEGGVQDERSMTPARLDAIRSFLAQRGIDRDRIVVESRIDEKLPEPRLDVQVITREPKD